MINIENHEPDPETFVVPDLPEVNVILDSINDGIDQMDAVAGGEAISFTPSQRYFHSVLYANDLMPLSSVSGNEEESSRGVFSAIGDGIQAGWNWIINMFKSVWNFFFGRDNAEVATETKKEIDENNKEVKDAENGTQSDEDAKKQASEMAKVASENKDEETARALREARTPKEVKEQVKQALKKMAKLNEKGKAKVAETIKLAVGAKNSFTKIATSKKSTEYAKANDSLVDKDHPVAHILIELEAEVEKALVHDKNFVPALEKALTLDTPEKVITFGKAIQSNVDSMKALGEAYNQRKNKMQAILDDTKKRMENASKEQNKNAMKREVYTLRVVVNQAVKIAKLIEVSNMRLRAVHKALIKRLCI